MNPLIMTETHSNNQLTSFISLVTGETLIQQVFDQNNACLNDVTDEKGSRAHIFPSRVLIPFQKEKIG